MLKPSSFFTRARKFVLVFGITLLIASLASIVFVAARNKGQEVAAPPLRLTEESLKADITARYGKLQLSFEVNAGESDKSVKFLSHGPGYDLFLTDTEAVLALRKPQKTSFDKFKAPPSPKDQPTSLEASLLRLKIIGANSNALVEGQDELPGKVNYILGDDPQKWRANVPTYRKVYYKEIYPGIDMVYYGNQRQLEFDFVVHAGTSPERIKFRIEGAARISLDKRGDLQLALNEGEVKLHKPVIYQLTEAGERSEIKGRYVVNGNEIAFKVPKFDSSKALIIDPVLSYSTLLGGGDAYGIGVDAQGNAYVTGVAGGLFPTTPGAFQTTANFGSAFVTKLDPTGSTLVYSTYLGGTGTSGSGSTTATAIAVDSSGNAHVTGFTSAPDFPLTNPVKTRNSFFKTTDGASSWTNVNSGLNTDVNALAAAPSAPGTIYAGTTSGPYRSTDGGATWTKTPVTGLSSFANVVSLAVDPGNAATVYAG